MSKHTYYKLKANGTITSKKKSTEDSVIMWDQQITKDRTIL